MWKVVIIVCALGNPCMIMEEDPMKYYNSKSECMANASAKHSLIVGSYACLLYTSPSPRDRTRSRMPSSA